MKKLLLLCLCLTGCTAVNAFSQRSEMTLKTTAHNPVTAEEGERTADSTICLHGSTRDVLASYQSALKFTLEQLGLVK